MHLLLCGKQPLQLPPHFWLFFHGWCILKWDLIWSKRLLFFICSHTVAMAKKGKGAATVTGHLPLTSPCRACAAAKTSPTHQTAPHFRRCKWVLQLHPGSCLGGNLLTPPSVRWERGWRQAAGGWARVRVKNGRGWAQNGQIGLAVSDISSPAGVRKLHEYHMLE